MHSNTSLSVSISKPQIRLYHVCFSICVRITGCEVCPHVEKAVLYNSYRTPEWAANGATFLYPASFAVWCYFSTWQNLVLCHTNSRAYIFSSLCSANLIRRNGLYQGSFTLWEVLQFLKASFRPTAQSPAGNGTSLFQNPNTHVNVGDYFPKTNYSWYV